MCVSNETGGIALHIISFKTLTQNCVTGTLPPSWCSNGTFEALQDLQLSSCGIQGNMLLCVVSGCASSDASFGKPSYMPFSVDHSFICCLPSMCMHLNALALGCFTHLCIVCTQVEKIRLARCPRPLHLSMNSQCTQAVMQSCTQESCPVRSTEVKYF